MKNLICYHPAKFEKIQGHNDVIYSLAIHGNLLISSSYDGTIIIWNQSTLEKVKIIAGHQKPIHSILVMDGVLYSASSDKSIKAWNLYECDSSESFQLLGHDSDELTLACEDGILVSASYDGEIRVWNVLSKESTIVSQQSVPVRTLCLVNNILYCGSKNVIQPINIISKEELCPYEGHSGAILAIVHNNNVLYSSSYDTTIRIWNTYTHRLMHILRGHTNWVSALHVSDGILYSGSADLTICLWDIHTCNCIQVIKGHTGAINSLLTSNYYNNENNVLYSCSYDYCIGIYM